MDTNERERERDGRLDFGVNRRSVGGWFVGAFLPTNYLVISIMVFFF